LWLGEEECGRFVTTCWIGTTLDFSNNINKNKYIQKDKYAYLWIWTVFGLIVGQE